jgi:hypothetical protein
MIIDIYAILAQETLLVDDLIELLDFVKSTVLTAPGSSKKIFNYIDLDEEAKTIEYSTLEYLHKNEIIAYNVAGAIVIGGEVGLTITHAVDGFLDSIEHYDLIYKNYYRTIKLTKLLKSDLKYSKIL